MTFAGYATRWLVQRTARLTPNAVRAYRAALVHHVLPTFDLYGSWLRQRRPDLTAILDREPAHHGIVRAERGTVLSLASKRSR